jgi:hypothetical protein
MDTWRVNYSELISCIKSHPEIEISPAMMVIPDGVRVEFYRLFNNARTQYVKDSYPQLANASRLGAAFFEYREKVISQLKLRSLEIDPNLGWFLQDPMDGLARKLFEPLFAVLEGKSSLGDFERGAMDIISPSGSAWLHRGYVHWVFLALLSLLSPEGLDNVPVEDESTNPDLTTADKRPGWYTVEVPKIVSSDTLFLDSSKNTPLLVPKAILRPGRVNAFASIATDLRSVYLNAQKPNNQVEWLGLEHLRQVFGSTDLWPDMALYVSCSEKNLEVVADYERVARPDVLVEVREAGSWDTPEGRERVMRHHHVLKPRQGTFVVCGESASGIDRSLDEDVHVLDAGFDSSRLAPVIEALAKAAMLAAESNPA